MEFEAFLHLFQELEARYVFLVVEYFLPVFFVLFIHRNDIGFQIGKQIAVVV